MQGSNVLLMPNRSPNPESIPALRHEVDELSKTVDKLQESLDVANQSAPWQIWVKEHPIWSKVVAGLIVALIVGIFSGIKGLIHASTNSYVDDRIRNLIKPLEDRLGTIDDKTSHIEGALSVLQAQIASLKYSNVPSQDLKAHRVELREVKDNLATVSRNTPNFWPTSFQIITLLSRATSEVKPTNQQESVLSDVDGVSKKIPDGSHVLLKNRIANMVFTNAVIRFDPSVRLENVTFINCVLIFPSVDQNPSQPLQRIGSELLATDLSHATIKGS